ncbi:hypothetical protein S1OALGB6SA_142 [Olavius algarvensis spirochete endosymbiont]|uniref:TVP38/TMEM64 family protein n=1 Tax=Olavius algarvensis spirochete endosymbiont TaxID=260710 RepID=UPI000F143D67|nr:VTT domain-containing protein [Olavius algarvensis spirochete endosymbiont]VDA99080.1 hypothetical protein S1OALGB6SA_142 [Olavius algarvensis spirochete endosymbiont]
MSEIWFSGLLTSYRPIAIPLSLLLEIAIAIVGVLPSYFITMANVAVFGIWWGTILSIAGESLGAVLAFLLYRKGLNKLSRGKSRFSTSLGKRMAQLSQAPPIRAFFLVLAFRLLPYMPSGAVTIAAAASRMNIFAFTTASTLGKIPSLVVEVASVSLAMRLPLKLFLVLLGGVIVIWAVLGLIRKKSV